MDRIDEAKHFSVEPRELAKELQTMYYVLAERLNFILDRVIDIDGEAGVELIKPGNVAGDNGNARLSINSDGDVIMQFKVAGTWDIIDTTTGPS